MNKQEVFHNKKVLLSNHKFTTHKNANNALTDRVMLREFHRLHHLAVLVPQPHLLQGKLDGTCANMSRWHRFAVAFR